MPLCITCCSHLPAVPKPCDGGNKKPRKSGGDCIFCCVSAADATHDASNGGRCHEAPLGNVRYLWTCWRSRRAQMGRLTKKRLAVCLI